MLATVSNGLNTAGYKSGIIYIVTGVILLLAVTLDTIARGCRSARVGKALRRDGDDPVGGDVRSRVTLPSGQRTISSFTFVASPRPKCTRGSSDER